MQVSEAPVTANEWDNILASEQVGVWHRDGRHLRLDVTEVDAARLTGLNNDQDVVTLEWQDIDRIEFKRIAAGRTTFLVAAIGLTAVILVEGATVFLSPGL